VHPYAWPHAWSLLFVVPPLVGFYVVVARLFPPTRIRVGAFAASQLLLVAAFATPMETIALHYLLAAHLLQNVVVAEWAPGLLVFSIPPAFARELERYAPVRMLTHPLVALPLWLATYFTWHVPYIYDRALANPATLLHFEHTAYFVAGMLMWWPVVHGRWSDGVKALYLFGAFVLASPLGLLLALLPRPAYAFYEHAPNRLWGIGRVVDQQIAGVTMAVEQAVVFFVVFTVYLQRFLRREAIAGVFSGSRR
jgi:cytochrome c oxidase assembly factor CtaG